MTIEEFLAECDKQKWHFTKNWVTRRLKELADVTKAMPSSSGV